MADADPDEPGQDGRGRWAGQTLEVPFVLGRDLGIETSQPQGRTSRMHESRHPAGLAQLRQSPGIHDQRRRGTERNHVGHAVVLGAEGTLGIGQTGHAAVQTIQHHGHKDRNRRNLEVSVHGRGDGIEPGEQGRRREQVGQQVNTASTIFSGDILFHHKILS